MLWELDRESWSATHVESFLGELAKGALKWPSQVRRLNLCAGRGLLLCCEQRKNLDETMYGLFQHIWNHCNSYPVFVQVREKCFQPSWGRTKLYHTVLWYWTGWTEGITIVRVQHIVGHAILYHLVVWYTWTRCTLYQADCPMNGT